MNWCLRCLLEWSVLFDYCFGNVNILLVKQIPLGIGKTIKYKRFEHAIPQLEKSK